MKSFAIFCILQFSPLHHYRMTNWYINPLFACDRRGSSDLLDFSLVTKAVVGGPAGPAMAGPLFLPEMVLAGPHFWPNTFFAGPFSHVSYRPSLMVYFSLIKD